MEKVSALHSSMKAIIASAEKLLDLCINAESSQDIEKIENCLIRTDDFISKIKQFEQLNSQMVECALKENMTLSTDHYALEDSFDNLSYSIRTKARNLQRLFDKNVNGDSTQVRSSPLTPRAENINSHVKLPLIKLPSFSGDITLYQSFIELFISLIHNHKDLSDVEKFHYLMLSLEGEPLSLIKCLKLTAVNYPIALDTLKKRYSNSRLIANNYLQTINRLNSISERSSLSLKYVVDQFKENWSAFKAVLSQTEDQLNLLAVNMLLQKLDVHTREQFELSIVDKKELIPSVDVLVEFVEKQSLALDNSGLNTVSRSNKWVKKDNKGKAKTSLSLVVNSVSVCPSCKLNHDVLECSVFLKKSPYERFKIIRNNNRCLNCFSCTHLVKACDSTQVCTKCARKHHSLLHYAKEGDAPADVPLPNIQSVSTRVQCNSLSSKDTSADDNVVFSGVIASSPTIMLATAVVNCLDITGTPILVRIVVDCGSQVNFITENCVQRLGLVRSYSSLSIRGLNQASSIKSRGIVKCTLSSRMGNNPKLSLDAHILPNICGDMPSGSLNIENWNVLPNLKLADPHFYERKPVDMLLGAELFPQILLGNVISGKSDNEPSAINTIFGYILMGKISNPINVETSCLLVESGLEEMVRQFWELEQIPSKSTSEIDPCEQHFRDTHFRNAEGRYTVALPFKDGCPPAFGDSYSIALKCLKYLESRLLKDPELYTLYQEAMQDYLQSGHMVPASTRPDPTQVYYIPHHGVRKPGSTSTQLRVVFNASSKSANGVSLNDSLLVGPKLHTDIAQILLHFRLPKFVIIADIKQMYRQILVKDEHRDFQRLLWRFGMDEPVQEYVLNRVTFGVSSAPYLALRTLKQLALDEAQHFPEASKVLLSNVFVDDVITGGKSIKETRDLVFDLINLLKKGGFELKKFASNEPLVLDHLPVSLQQPISFDYEEPSFIKVLGLQWSPTSDCFSYNICSQSSACTKRKILSELARVFDPLGFLAPLVVVAKHLIQKLWMIGIDWDQAAPCDIVSQWKKHQSELPLLSNLSLPRFLDVDEFTKCEIHGFCDSSEIAYAAVVYFRVLQPNGDVCTSLICSKTRIAPLKRLSIPRLELSSAVLLAELITFIVNTFDQQINFSNITAWSDSQTALAWIKSPCFKWKTFVANRVALIQDLLPSSCWNYICSQQNPADCATRGLSPSQLLDHSLWWAGPEWLKQSQACWPIQPQQYATAEETKENSLCLSIMVGDDILSLGDKISSLSKLQRVLAYCLRFISACQKRETRRGPFTSNELQSALLVLVRLTQQVEFGTVIKQIKQGHVSAKPLRKLNPFLDSFDILRVGGRLRNSSLNYDCKHPILLPRKCRLTELIILHFHKLYLHPGHNTLLALLRRQFWILSPHRAIKSILAKCHGCFRINPRTYFPLMADLPQARVSEVKAFKFVGVDFCGPFSITMSKVRGAKVLKAYLCVFVCFTTKAVHLELASDLSTEAFLAAFRRFLSRRGKCIHVYSDCGTNFVGANHALKLCMQSVVESEGFTWHFNPPSSPHMGGLWESQMKVIKRHLIKTIGEQILTFEELSTVFIQIEALLNSRPLQPISSDPNDLTALTPSHFLNLEPLGSLPEEDFSDLDMSRLSRWQKIQCLQQHFWRRWSSEYLTTLQQRNAWHDTSNPITIGKLVLIKNELMPPLQWKLARITEVFPGADKIVRVVKVRTASGEFKRPVVKVCPLPNQ